jgi:hypothetical protein
MAALITAIVVHIHSTRRKQLRGLAGTQAHPVGLVKHSPGPEGLAAQMNEWRPRPLSIV